MNDWMYLLWGELSKCCGFTVWMSEEERVAHTSVRVGKSPTEDICQRFHYCYSINIEPAARGRRTKTCKFPFIREEIVKLLWHVTQQSGSSSLYWALYFETGSFIEDGSCLFMKGSVTPAFQKKSGFFNKTMTKNEHEVKTSLTFHLKRPSRVRVFTFTCWVCLDLNLSDLSTLQLN